MRVLSNDDVERLVTMPECMDALEAMYRDLADDRALASPRMDSITPSRHEGAYYAFKQMGGTWPSRGMQALRLNSDVITHPVVDGKPRRVKVPAADGRWVGLVALFSTDTGELLALFPDGVAQRLRVGAANGLAARYLARRDARTVALIGTGWQAGAQLMAIRAVRELADVRVFSPNAAHRDAFVADARAGGVPATPAASAANAARGADIILSATSSMVRTVDPAWLAPGVHLSTIKSAEVDDDVLRRCDRVFVHAHDKALRLNSVMPGTPNLSKEAGDGWWNAREGGTDAYPDLPALVSGRSPGLERDDQVTCFVNNVGLGLQFAALGSLLLEKAVAEGAGHELPNEWFTESVHS